MPKTNFWPHLSALGAALLMISGCVSQTGNELRQFDKRTKHGWQAPASHVSSEPQPRSVHPVNGTAIPYDASLTLREAVRRALTYSPAITAARHEITAKYGEAYQASVRPNPEIEGELENFFGTGDFSGFRRAETTLGVTQLIERGGKRARRLHVAELNKDLAYRDLQSVRVHVARQAAEAFAEVLAAQQRVRLSRRLVRLVTELRQTVSKRIDAGQDSPVELQRADVEAARARGIHETEKVKLRAARRALGLIWGAQKPRFGRAAGKLARSTTIMGIDRVLRYLDKNPRIARWAEELLQRQAVLDLERAKAVTDVKIGAGARRLSESDDTAVVARVSMPLQVFDRNTGNIAAARARLDKAKSSAKAARLNLQTVVVEAYGALEAAGAQVRSIRGQVVPAARAAFQSIRRGYQEGKFDLLNVLDAQRRLFTAQREALDAQAKFEKARARIESFIGRKI